LKAAVDLATDFSMDISPSVKKRLSGYTIADAKGT